MAVAVAINSSEGLHYNGKVTWLVALSCIIAASGGLLFGYDTGVTGGVTSMESFLKKFFPGVYIQMKEDTNLSNYCKFDSQLLTSFTSSLYISCLIASFLAASVTRDYGRKPSIIIGGVAFLFGAVLGG
ncbi:UNVERIFIED_CONTAM: Hexose carrier protein HEX6 [Sesamum radiatum]